MSAEHHGEPTVLHALEEARDALHTEQRAQEPLSRENVRLRARSEQLRAERDQLLRAMESTRHEPSPSAPRLPEPLVPPFTRRAQTVLRQQARWFLPAPLMVVLMLAVEWNHDSSAWVFHLPLLLLVVVVQGVWLMLRRGGPRWSFDEVGFEVGGLKGTGLVRYSEVVDVEVHVSASQRRRGVGTVVVTYSSWGKLEERSQQLKDVPEPEQLAAWLRAKRSDTA